MRSTVFVRDRVFPLFRAHRDVLKYSLSDAHVLFQSVATKAPFLLNLYEAFLFLAK